jgi:hypothetical protein
MSRVKAKKAAGGRHIVREMESQGIIVRGQSRRPIEDFAEDGAVEATGVY